MTVFIDMFRHMLQYQGGVFLDLLDYLGGMSHLALKTFRALFVEEFPMPETLRQCDSLGVRSLALTNLVLIFTGMVLALQFIVGLSRFGLELYSGQVIGLAIMRELGPVLTALMVAARAGSGIAAELGSMVVTEQVMAIEAMGANPYRHLVLPRLLITTLVTPILTAISDLTGLLGGMVVAFAEADIAPRFFIDQIVKNVEIADFFSGIGKSVCFGFLIGIVCCYHGLSTTGGTRGVGRSTTSAVVASSIFIFISDYFLTKLFLVF